MRHLDQGQAGFAVQNEINKSADDFEAQLKASRAKMEVGLSPL